MTRDPRSSMRRRSVNMESALAFDPLRPASDLKAVLSQCIGKMPRN